MRGVICIALLLCALASCLGCEDEWGCEPTSLGCVEGRCVDTPPMRCGGGGGGCPTGRPFCTPEGYCASRNVTCRFLGSDSGFCGESFYDATSGSCSLRWQGYACGIGCLSGGSCSDRGTCEGARVAIPSCEGEQEGDYEVSVGNRLARYLLDRRTFEEDRKRAKEAQERRHKSSPSLSNGLPCKRGRYNCDGDPSNGCETDVLSDRSHCGSCDRSCEEDEVCGTGVCVDVRCRPGFADCDEDATHADCETSLLDDPEHCGSCRNACPLDGEGYRTRCVGGRCEEG